MKLQKRETEYFNLLTMTLERRSDRSSTSVEIENVRDTRNFAL